MAVWGASSAGKSVLLSWYIDGPSPDGSDSALYWPGGTMARFTPASEMALRLFPGTIIVNPHHGGHDATSVATRFTLADTVLDPLHPVELFLASEGQILHSIAAGYIYECTVQNGNGELVVWNVPNLETLVAKLANPLADSPNPDSFRILRTGFEVLENMLMVREPRFQNLNIGDAWPSLRRNLLLRSTLINSAENALEFIRTLLWDNHNSLNQLSDRIMNRRANLATEWGSRAILCSIETAALLLDIQS